MENGPLSLLRQHILSTKGVLIVALLFLNLLVFSLTDPVNSPPIVVVMGFLVLAADIFLLVRGSVWFLAMFVGRLQPHKRRITALVTGFLVICMGLGSIGQLTWRDILVVVIVAGVGYFYSLYFRFRAKQ